MTDLARTIEPKSDQLNADTLMAGPRTITITGVRGNEDADQPISIHFEGGEKTPYKPCKSMRRVMVHCWGPDGSKYVGRRMTLFCDPTVVFGGIKVGGIRISHMSDIDRDITMALTATRAQRKPYTVHPLPGGSRASLVDLTAVLAAGRSAALQGSARLTEWWVGLTKAEKAAAKAALDDELKPAAARIDQAALESVESETGEILESDLPGHDDEPGDEGFPGDRPATNTAVTWGRDFLDWIPTAPPKALTEAWAEAKREGKTAALQNANPDLFDDVIAAKERRLDAGRGSR
jgi:hypothetical protein